MSDTIQARRPNSKEIPIPLDWGGGQSVLTKLNSDQKAAQRTGCACFEKLQTILVGYCILTY